MRRLLGLVALFVVVAPAAAHAEPLISRTCNGGQDCARWFTVPVTLRWTVVAGNVVTGCETRTISTDTDFDGQQYGCVASDGNEEVGRSVTIRVDRTAPLLTDAIPSRPPDHAGWYTHPVTFTAAGADVTSGIAACEGATYGGPDADPATVVLGCRDVAGNAAQRAFPLRYDATPPDTSGITATTADREVRLRWPAVASAAVVRTPGTGAPLTADADGLTDVRVRNGVAYRYVVTLADAAGNAASRELVVVPGPRLLTPAKRAILTAPPRLSWTPVRGARYYNVQLFRGNRKILSAWPRRPHLQLRARWRFGGKQRRLAPGRYRWYVWPGEGPRAAERYGKRIGARSFVVQQ